MDNCDEKKKVKNLWNFLKNKNKQMFYVSEDGQHVRDNHSNSITLKNFKQECQEIYALATMVDSVYLLGSV